MKTIMKEYFIRKIHRYECTTPWEFRLRFIHVSE